jgi:hypothetical protein
MIRRPRIHPKQIVAESTWMDMEVKVWHFLIGAGAG